MATACLSIPRFRVLREVPEAARCELQHFTGGIDAGPPPVLATRQQIREVFALTPRACIAPVPLRLITQLDGHFRNAEARTPGHDAEDHKQVDAVERRNQRITGAD